MLFISCLQPTINALELSNQKPPLLMLISETEYGRFVI